MTAVWLDTTSSHFSGGDGSPSHPFVIATLSDLQYLSEHAEYWTMNFVQSEDIDASSTRNWSNGAGFAPIGNDTAHFTGSYNGGGHTISGLYIDRPNDNAIGLFGTIDGATIDSLILTNVNITGGNNVGGLVGNSNNSDINDCYVLGAVSGQNNVGGLVGSNNSGSNINGSYSSVVLSGNQAVGGLAGANLDSSTISNSYAAGAVNGNTDVGGLVGNNAGTVNTSYASGVVNGNGSTNVGGLVGNNIGTGNVNNSYYDSQTTGQTDTGKGTPKTTEDMMSKNTFAQTGWNFPIWNINEGKSYPYFAAQSAPVYVNAKSADSISLSVLAAADSIVIYDSKNNPIRVIAPATSGDHTLRDLTLPDTFYIINYEHGKAPSYPVWVILDTVVSDTLLIFDDYAMVKFNDNTFFLNVRKLKQENINPLNCHWYKNGEEIGEGFVYSAGDFTINTLESAVYTFMIETIDKRKFYSTEKTLEHRDETARLLIYPNPVSDGRLTIDYGQLTIGEKIEIYNTQGTLVDVLPTTAAKDNSVTINIGHLPAGVYILKTEHTTTKVVVKK
ncbi:hypothetical protein FACS1894156_7900 [Bacteroidia bacterium]|nr:hypothetical protein FACS1894156_7900 [Bacteroidia bacterium]